MQYEATKNQIMSHEPPVKKRQRIDVASSASSSSKESSSPSTSSSSFSSTNSLNEPDQLIEPEWLDALQNQQCLCGVSVDIRKPFQRYISADLMHQDRIDEWPSENVLKYLSSVHMFFDLYLKQNRHGTICGRAVEVVDAIVSGHGLNIAEDLLSLCDRRLQCKGADDTKFCLFLAGQVISTYLIIVKDDVEQKWMKKIVDNLFIFESLNDLAIRKINISLDIIKYVIDFKDMEEHPLEDGCDSMPLPPIENNYFAQVGGGRSLFGDVGSSSTTSVRPNLPNTCQFVTLTDSESFDTTHIKCVTIKQLENKWPALVETMTTLITQHQANVYAEPCALTFLGLWENIISVKTNLSVVETLPFYSHLDKFADLFRTHPSALSSTIYKHMLALFNEALCYGSTLALQDLLPEETCSLAHQMVRHVKDFRILEHLPRTQDTVSDFGSTTRIEYKVNSFDLVPRADVTAATFDRCLLQKMTLLVLKCVAVTVKEIRSDSSDSSIDSTDYDAFQDMLMIERSIRDVLKKLESFIKLTLEFHPESHFSKILIHLFSDQDDYLIEAMVCTLDVTAGISFRNNAFPELVAMLNPVYTFLEFLKMIANSSDLLLDLLVSNETCFLLYLLRFLKYIRLNWSMFVQSCRDSTVGGTNCLDDTMSVLIRLRLQISRLVSKSLYPYDISPILRLLESCESLYEGNELS